MGGLNRNVDPRRAALSARGREAHELRRARRGLRVDGLVEFTQGSSRKGRTLTALARRLHQDASTGGHTYRNRPPVSRCWYGVHWLS